MRSCEAIACARREANAGWIQRIDDWSVQGTVLGVRNGEVRLRYSKKDKKGTTDMSTSGGIDFGVVGWNL